MVVSARKASVKRHQLLFGYKLMTIESNNVAKAEQAEQAEEDPFVALAAQDEASARSGSGSAAEAEDFSLSLTPRAVARLRALQEEEQGSQLTLRVRIYSGGCSGYRNEFSLDNSCDKSCSASDLEICQDGVKVLIDKLSARTLGASELDFTNDIIGEGFTLRIAKAHSACGCGVSFGL